MGTTEGTTAGSSKMFSRVVLLTVPEGVTWTGSSPTCLSPWFGLELIYCKSAKITKQYHNIFIYRERNLLIMYFKYDALW